MSATIQNKSDKAVVSIIIPFFNRENFLAEAVTSVLAQTYQNWELILINDGSTDKSPQIAADFVKQYPGKISLYAHENGANHGASSSRNRGVKYASGDFITFLDSDDVFLPATLATEVKFFERNAEAEAVCGTLQYWFSWTDEADKKERDFVVNLGLETGKIYAPPDLLIHNLRAGGRKPGIGCVILRSELARKFSLFEDDFKYVGEDQIFWAKVSLHAKIYVSDECFAKYRQHNSSRVSNLINSGRTTDGWGKFSVWMETYLRENEIKNKEVWKALKMCRKENDYRLRFEKLINLYQKMLPYHVRYRVRDFIVRWRTRK